MSEDTKSDEPNKDEPNRAEPIKGEPLHIEDVNRYYEGNSADDSNSNTKGDEAAAHVAKLDTFSTTTEKGSKRAKSSISTRDSNLHFKPYEDDSDPKKHVLQEWDCYEKLGYSFSTRKKWSIILVIGICQLSMNFNASVYPHAVPLIAKYFHISTQAANTSQMIFLVAYAFGCELWAPWSEEYGRWIVMQCSFLSSNIWQILGGLAPNFGSIVVARFLGGISLAGGSVTLGVAADMWDPTDHGYAVAFVVLCSVGGTVIGPVFGGLMEEHLNWHWNFWIQLIFNGATQILHFFIVPETRSTVIMDRLAKNMRQSGEDIHVYGPGEVKKFSFKELLETWFRPFQMFVYEPIVLLCSLLSGFADHLIFICNQSFGPIFQQWNFSTTAQGLTFITLMVAYLIAYALHLVDIRRQRQIMDKIMHDRRGPERRLLLLLFLAPFLSIGLFGFAWTTMGPEYTPWIAPCIFSTIIGIGNYSIYMATIDYMVAAYGPYSASATGGNGFARDLLAGIAAMYATPLYNNIGGRFHYQWASTLLGCLGIVCTIPIYVFYWKGPVIREKSKFAVALSKDFKEEREKEGKDDLVCHNDEEDNIISMSSESDPIKV